MSAEESGLTLAAQLTRKGGRKTECGELMWVDALAGNCKRPTSLASTKHATHTELHTRPVMMTRTQFCSLPSQIPCYQKSSTASRPDQGPLRFAWLDLT